METPDTFAAMSQAVRGYGWSVKQIKRAAATYSLIELEELRRDTINAPSFYVFWDAVIRYKRHKHMVPSRHFWGLIWKIY